MTTSTRVIGVPLDLTASPEEGWDVTDGVLRTTALAQSDIFIDPAGRAPSTHNARTLLAPAPEGDFQFSARVSVDFNGDFDAGVLLVRASEDRWAKLCFEYSPDREPMVVSVVCRGVADDANAYVVEEGAVWLRVSRIGSALAFHASADGRTWRFVRYFALGTEDVQIGFEAQAPVGPGCEVRFDSAALVRETLKNLRDGS